MPPRLRKSALTVHIVSSVGWLGAVAAFLVVAVAVLTSQDTQMARGLLLAMGPITWYAVLPLAFATTLTGIIQALGTQWGLIRHYWVVCKLLITVLLTLVLLQYTQTVEHLPGAAADLGLTGADLRTLAVSPALHAGLALLALLVPVVLSVFKPRGTTRYGQRDAAR